MLDRNSEASAREFFEHTFPAPAARAGAEAHLAALIRLAHAASPAGWEITLKKRLLRFNVGPMELLVFAPDAVRLVGSSAALGVARPPRGVRVRAVAYPSVKKFEKSDVRGKPDDVAAVLAFGGEASKVLVDVAARARRGRSRWWEAMSLGVVKHLRTACDDVTLPEPNYAVDLATVSPAELVAAGARYGAPETNPEVEAAAIATAVAWYRERGFIVDESPQRRAGLGYDLLCKKGRREKHVEVKGISGDAFAFFLEPSELKRLEEDDDFALFIVTRALSADRLASEWPAAAARANFRVEACRYRATLKTD